MRQTRQFVENVQIFAITAFPLLNVTHASIFTFFKSDFVSNLAQLASTPSSATKPVFLAPSTVSHAHPKAPA